MITKFRIIKILNCLLITFLLISCKENKGASNSHEYTNALINETSPYLLQHAHNPVNWRPWSQEALDEAVAQNKLVLVSIGYSSCHWCHVMEEETFEDEEVAEFMNANYINIKVDREERPDVDEVYMTALQLLKGTGGWPLNVITLPNGKPLYGGTYHTKEQWLKVLAEISKLYTEDPQRARSYAERVAAGIQEVSLIEAADDTEAINKQTLATSIENWKKNWDLEWGGNTGRQKFMLPSNLNFLMNYGYLTQDTVAIDHVQNTLNKIAQGGIYDHLGGGFFRYSTDPYWKIPHFEKMLYDNAQLLGVYSKAFKQFKLPSYKQVVFETLEFLKREMRHPDGGYYAAIDADTKGEEGVYYIWKEDEIDQILGNEADTFKAYYAVQTEYSWEEGSYVLHQRDSDQEFLLAHELSSSSLTNSKKAWKNLLLEARSQRIHPNIDDKIITSWNALLISGLVEAYKAFGDEDILAEAISIYNFLEKNNTDNERLIHSFKQGGKEVHGFLDDYTFMVRAAIDLYEVTMDKTYLDRANKLHDLASGDFEDRMSGLYRFNSKNELISKIVKINDGITPSPNAMMARNSFALGHIYYDRGKLDKADQMLATIAPAITKDATNFTDWILLLLQRTYPYYEIAVVGNDARSILTDLHKKQLPNTLLVGSTKSSSLPLFDSRFVKDETYIYVCQNNSCKLPTTSVQAAIEQLDLH